MSQIAASKITLQCGCYIASRKTLFFHIFIMNTVGVTLYLLFSAKLQLIEYSVTIPKFPELTGNFGESGRRLGVER